MKCPKCGGEMKVVAFIETRPKGERLHERAAVSEANGNRAQADVIEKILKHCGIWERAPPRPSPAEDKPPEQSEFELEYVDTEEFLAAL